MQPKTHIQKEVVRLSKLMPGITQAQASYAHRHCFDRFMYRTKKKSVCFECGHEWETDQSHFFDAIIGNTCPSCGEKLKLSESKGWRRKDFEYFCIFTTFKGYQLIRYFVARRWCRLGEKATYKFDEVIQHWINPDGKRVVMTIRVNGMSMYYDNWAFESEIEVRTLHHRAFPSINGVYIYPKKRFVPNVLRNGFQGDFYSIHPSDLFCMILGDNKAETLIKMGQYKLVEYYHRHEAEVIERWPSVKICARNGYLIEDPSMWFDHLELLERFGKDIHSPKYICPRNLKADHQRLTNKAMRIDDREQYERKKKEEYENKLFREAKKRLFDLEFTDGDIRVVVLRTPQQFKKEGEILKHCVYVNGYYKRDTSLIMSARKGKERLETIELSLKDMKILQCRGYKNEETSYHKAIMDLVQKNTKVIKKRIKQVA